MLANFLPTYFIMKMKNVSNELVIGRIPFLVCAPFFHASLQGIIGIRFEDGVPSHLNGLLRSGAIDAAPSSSFEYALRHRDYVLLPEVSTSSRMEMKSVLFLSNLPWESLEGKPVGLSPHSSTSNALFRLLCRWRFGINPSIYDGVADSVLSGQVFIGDEALQQARSGRWQYRYDLAEEWRQWQNLPFSFGLWIVREAAVHTHANELRLWKMALHKSVQAFEKAPSSALKKWTTRYPSDIPMEDMLDFYKSADYGFSEGHQESLRRFFGMAFEAQMLPELPQFRFFDSEAH